MAHDGARRAPLRADRGQCRPEPIQQTRDDGQKNHEAAHRWRCAASCLKRVPDSAAAEPNADRDRNELGVVALGEHVVEPALDEEPDASPP